MHIIFCPQCHELILDLPACPACGWQRPRADGDAGALVWQAELGRRLAKPRCYPVVAGGRYCAPTEDGAIVALDLASGEPAWERALGEGSAAYALATDGTRLFVGCTDTRPIPVHSKTFLALDARSGATAWEYPTSAHSHSAAAVAGATVYFTSSDGLLHAVSVASGQRRWAVAHPFWGPAAPAVASDVICVGGRSEALVAYSPVDGVELWRFAAGGWFAGELTIAEDRVFALCWDGYLYVLDARSGRLLWRARGERDNGFTAPPAAAAGRAFIGSRVNADERQQRLYALLALSVEDGGELWRRRTRRHIFASPLLAADTLLFGTDTGKFYALDAADGAERWDAQIDGPIVAQPQVDGDMVYVGERGGTVYAFRWRASPAEALLAPAAYLARGEHEQAAVAYALGDQPDAAAALYEQVGHPHEAALLYERAGQAGKAAPLWEQLGELRRARDRYADAADNSGLARMLAQLGEPRQAAALYEQIGSLDTAAQLYEESGDRVKAAELYDQAGQYSRARAIWESLGHWERQVEDLVREGQPDKAAAILEQRDQQERAAELYEQAGQLQRALRIRMTLEHWEHVVALAARTGDAEPEASAHERLGQTLGAAEAYERAAEQAVAHDEVRAAELYERAARLYEEIYEQERAVTCRREVRRYRRLPDVVIAGGADTPLVEYEWNVLTLRVENAGYGPARTITIMLRGAFDVEGDLQIAALPPGRSVTIEISVRPHREHYGPKVPLEIVLQYQDAHGAQYDIAQRQRVNVVRQGAERNIVTPPELRVDGQRAPARQGTLDQEAIDQQISLLKAHRARLNVLLEQQARLGVAYAPPGVAIGIDEARADIRRIKEVLRRAGTTVDDSPNDDAPAISAPADERDEPAASPAVLDKRTLREALVQTFSLDELEVLCADVEQDLATDGIATQVNLELVGGSGKAGKVLNLILYLDRRGYLGYLVNAARRSRPGSI